MRHVTLIIAHLVQGAAEGAESEGTTDTFGLIFAAFVGVFMLSVIIGELFRRRTKQKKPGDDSRSTVFYLALLVFVVSALLAGFTQNGVWILVALPAWLVGFISQERGERRRRREIQALRAQNAKDYPGVFDRDPPQDLDAIPGDRVDVYDNGTCTYIGRFPKSDMRVIIERFDIEDNSKNDIFICGAVFGESEMLSPAEISASSAETLKAAFEAHWDLFLRWMPVSEEGGAEELDHGSRD